MIAKVLPVLMVSVLFIFVNADVWKLANNMSFVRAFEGVWGDVSAGAVRDAHNLV